MHDEHDRDPTSERIAELPNLYKPSPYVEPGKGGEELRACANRRVAYISRSGRETV